MKKISQLIVMTCVLTISFINPSTAADRYWVGTVISTDWSNTANWATTSGGAGGASVPSSSDNAIFDANGLNSVLDMDIDVASIQFDVSYASTLTQSIYNIDMGSGLFSGGVFAGGSGTITTGDIVIDGAVFTSTTDILDISGDLTLDGISFAQTAGTVTFSGGSLQNINVNAVSPVGFFNLIVDNSGPGISLGNNIEITNELTMNQGNIALNGDTILLGVVSSTGILNHTSGYMTGNGTFSRWFPVTSNLVNVPIGADDGLFPMGVGTSNRSVWVGLGDGVVTTSGIISVSYNDVPGYTDITEFTDNGVDVSRRLNSNWEVTQSGLVLGIGPADEEFILRVAGDDLPGISDYNDLRLIRATDAIGVHSATTGSNAAPRANRSGNDMPDNTYYYAGDPAANPMPVSLISFDATKNAIHMVSLNWVTAWEINNSHFDVERSTDGVEWKAIQRIEGHGNSNTTRSYSATDNLAGVEAPVIYYRLLQTDFNGEKAYSIVRSLSLKQGRQPVAMAYPNPAYDFLTLQWVNETNAPATLTITDNVGRVVYSEIISGNGLVSKKLDMTSHVPGLYVLAIKNGTKVQSQLIYKN